MSVCRSLGCSRASAGSKWVPGAAAPGRWRPVDGSVTTEKRAPVDDQVESPPVVPADAADNRLVALFSRSGSVVCLQSQQGDLWTWYLGIRAEDGDDIDGRPVEPGRLYWVVSTEAPLRDILPDLLVASASGAIITAATQELYDAFVATSARELSQTIDIGGRRRLLLREGQQLLRMAPPGTVPPPSTDGSPVRVATLPLPARIPQQTFQEAKSVAISLADGPTLRRWTPIEGEIALRHAVKDVPLETKLVGTTLLNWLGLPNTVDSLRQEVQSAGLPAVLMLHVVLGAALDKILANRAHVTVSIDQLVAAIGWEPRSRAERQKKRAQVWRWLALFDAMQVIGRRDGKWRDPDTHQVIDLTSRDALIRITGRRDPAQLSFDEGTPPLEVSYVAGPWLEKFRGDRRVLADFGNVRKLAAIKAGKPSGAWAQAIGLALQQRWRERASYAQIAHVGEDKSLTVRSKPIARRELLDLFPPTPTVDEVLASNDPGRAKKYWDDAIDMLKAEGIVTWYRELTPLPAKRKGWGRDWLDQPLDIRPADEEKAAIAEIATRAQTRRRAARRRKAASDPG
jgi:hypothetical protein